MLRFAFFCSLSLSPSSRKFGTRCRCSSWGHSQASQCVSESRDAREGARQEPETELMRILWRGEGVKLLYRVELWDVFLASLHSFTLPRRLSLCLSLPTPFSPSSIVFNLFLSASRLLSFFPLSVSLYLNWCVCAAIVLIQVFFPFLAQAAFNLTLYYSLFLFSFSRLLLLYCEAYSRSPSSLSLS